MLRVSDVDDSAFDQFPGLRAALEEERSVTELEVLHAVLQPFHPSSDSADDRYSPAAHAFFFQRNDAYLDSIPDDPPALKRIFTDQVETDPERRDFLLRKQSQLRKEVQERRRPLHVYSATWNPARRTPEIALPLQSPSAEAENQERWREEWLRVGGLEVTDQFIEESTALGDRANAAVGH